MREKSGERTQKSGERTLLASVILSSPGPLVVGLGLLVGRSSTQLADFIRRTAELGAIIVSWIMYRVIHKKGEPDPAYREKLERIANLCVGGAMCISGIAMLFVAIFSPHEEKGNVIPGLIIAFLGVVVNGWFWIRYTKLDRQKPDGILAVQSKLYRAKTLVDGCITFALAFVAFAPPSALVGYVDMVGSVIVSLYLVVTGYTTIRDKKIAVIGEST